VVCQRLDDSIAWLFVPHRIAVGQLLRFTMGLLFRCCSNCEKSWFCAPASLSDQGSLPTAGGYTTMQAHKQRSAGDSRMNRKELINAIADKTGSSKADADRSIGALIEIISTTLKKGDNLALVGFGTFEVRKRAARNGRNPSTGEAIKIKASKQPAFKAGATLKATVNGVKK
jgi:DNA-binding protein HU-beta